MERLTKSELPDGVVEVWCGAKTARPIAVLLRVNMAINNFGIPYQSSGIIFRMRMMRQSKKGGNTQ